MGKLILSSEGTPPDKKAFGVLLGEILHVSVHDFAAEGRRAIEVSHHAVSTTGVNVGERSED